MAGLKKSEKRLLTMFGVALFVVANLLGDGIFGRKKAGAQAAIEERREEIAEYEALKKNEDMMSKRRDWLARWQPRFVSEEAAATDIEDHVRNCASISGVTIDSSKPTEPIENPDFTQVAINVNVSGGAPEVTQFVSLLQTRDGFYAIPSITYTTDRRDNTVLRCAATVARWYGKNGGASAEAPAGDSFAASGQN